MAVQNNKNIDSARKAEIKKPTFAVVAAVNDDECLVNNLAASPMLAENGVPLIVKRDYKSAGLAYNAGLEQVIADVVIFAHQDVYFPRGWDKKLFSTIKGLELEGNQWGVLGVVGKDRTNNLVGGAWSNGLQLKIESEFRSPVPVGSMDEIVIVLRKESGLRFDDNLPGFHLYGTDVVLSALKAGLGAYVFDGPVIHNSVPVVQLDGFYVKAYRYMQRKWKAELPIWTTVVPVTKSGWPLLRKRISQSRKHIFKRMPVREQYARHEAPSRLASDLGYG